jgi:hypothetical protein
MDPPVQYGAGFEMQQMPQAPAQAQPVYVQSYVVHNMPAPEPQGPPTVDQNAQYTPPKAGCSKGVVGAKKRFFRRASLVYSD